MTHLDQFRKRFLSAATFAQRAFSEIEKLPTKDYWLRPKKSEAKKLIEEVLPLAMVAKYLDIPGRRVSCKYLGQDGGECDGKIKIKGEWVKSGFLEPCYSVEVTSAQFKNEHYLRESLERYGSVFDDPNICRIGSKKRGNDRIVSRAVAQDGDQVVKDLIDWIAGAVDRKVNQHAPYPRPCIFIISLNPWRPLWLSEWLRVIESFPRDIARQSFALTFLVETDRGAVYQAA